MGRAWGRGHHTKRAVKESGTTYTQTESGGTLTDAPGTAAKSCSKKSAQRAATMGTTSAQGRNRGTNEHGASTIETASNTLTTGPITAFAIGAMSEKVPNAGTVMGSVASCEQSVTESIPAMPAGTPNSPKA